MITEYCSDLHYLHTILYHPIIHHVSNIRGMGSTVVLQFLYHNPGDPRANGIIKAKYYTH